VPDNFIFPKAREKDGRKYAVIFLFPNFIKQKEIVCSQNIAD
jgi:hypothetical protein